MKKEKIPWGKDGSIEFEMPRGWNLLGRFSPAKMTPLSDVEKELEKVLQKPTESAPLPELGRGKKSVVIVVDDISRPTPAHLLMGKILENLSEAGVADNSITVIPGLGMHRPMTREEMERKVGRENLARVKWENHDYRDREKLAYLGKTKRGTRAYVNKKVAKADLVVLVGTVEPHIHAGFGGGYKNILPGVAGVETIARNHAICAHPKYFSMIGTAPEKNPMRLDIEEAGRMLRGETFLVNTVLDADGQIVRIVAGDPVAAHSEGVETASQVYGVKIPRPADVVITDSFPMDLDLRQGVKAVANVLFAAKPGGVIVAAMKCDEGLGSVRVPRIRLPVSAGAARLFAWVLSLAITKIAPPGISEEERFVAYFLFRAVLRNKILLFAPAVAEEIDGKIPLIKTFKDFGEAIRAAGRVKPNADVLIFPQGSVTYPIK